MATILRSQFVQSFVNASSIVITHNLDINFPVIQLLIDGKSRADLVTMVVSDPLDRSNKLTVELKSPQTGSIQVLSTDVIDIERFGVNVIEEDDVVVSPAVSTVNFEGNVTVVDDGGHKVTVTVGSGGSGTGIGSYDDVHEFGEGGTISNKFMKSSYSNHTCLDSTTLALADGEVVHVTISTEKNPTNNWFVQVIINGVKGGAGQYADGTQIGTDLEKTTAILDKVYTNLSGYSFSAGDRIQVYVKEGTLGEKSAVEPVVRLFVRYD